MNVLVCNSIMQGLSLLS